MTKGNKISWTTIMYSWCSRISVRNRISILTFKGTVAWDFCLVFYESTPDESLKIFSNFVLNSPRYLWKRGNFLRYNPRKVKLSADYTSECFLIFRNISAKSKQISENLSQDIRGNSKLSADYTAERHTFLRDDPRKVSLQKVAVCRRKSKSHV
jgi:hypothetical protein